MCRGKGSSRWSSVDLLCADVTSQSAPNVKNNKDLGHFFDFLGYGFCFAKKLLAKIYSFDDLFGESSFSERD